LASRAKIPSVFVEPFAGGAVIALTVAFEGLARKVIVVELDDDVASVWKTVLGNGARWLANRIVSFKLSSDSVIEELSRIPKDDRERAFQTILRNRVYHGGILAAGSGLIKNGENGRGIASRWYPETLAKRILDIERVKHLIRFMHCDGFEVTRAFREPQGAVFFFDPPYTAGGKRAGTRLYTHFEIDHARLFDIAAGLKGDFLMTYDLSVEVAELALLHGFDVEQIPMTNKHHAEMRELLIARDLAWAR
jgi:DNA adenine methylase